MRVPITYIASSGHKYNLISNGILHKKANYHTWAYKVQGTKLQYGMRVADFAKDPAVYDTEIYADVLVITETHVFSLEFKMKDVIDPEEEEAVSGYEGKERHADIE